MTVYADTDDLDDYLGDGHTAPSPTAEATRWLTRASELIDTATRGRAQAAYDGDLSSALLNPGFPPTSLTQEEYRAVLVRAACAQVEFWLETGEEHDVVGLHGSAQAGRVSFSKLPPRLGPRAFDALVEAGLISARAWIR